MCLYVYARVRVCVCVCILFFRLRLFLLGPVARGWDNHFSAFGAKDVRYFYIYIYISFAVPYRMRNVRGLSLIVSVAESVCRIADEM